AGDSTTPANGGETCSWTTGPLTCTVTGLTNGDTYSFTVWAANRVGLGPSSPASNPVTPLTVPGAPSGVSATAGDVSAIVTWTAPGSDGGSPVTGYTVVAGDSTTPANGGETCSWTTGPLTCTVTGLTNGDAYSFTVGATNSVGPGPSSPGSNTVTPGTVPGPPSGVSGTAGDADATVIWTAPASDGGSPVTGYTVVAGDSTTPANGGETCSWTTGPLTCTVTGLTNGDTYSFIVWATNDIGLGPSSPDSNAVTPVTVPGAPSGVSAAAGDGSAIVTWAAPASDGGSPVTGYTVVAGDSTTPANGGQTCTWTTGPLTCTVTGLTNSDTYSFTATAVSAVGQGASSTMSNAVIPGTVPDPPTISLATPGVSSAMITWIPPISDGGAPITSYTVAASDVTTPANGDQTCTWTAGPLTCTVTGLTIGDVYVLGVSATNDVGTSTTAISGLITPLP
ncbi:MAG: fibronectin type III domain-containing protein, partial [Acidimicrobiales bacterium]